MKVCLDAGHGHSDPGAIGRAPGLTIREADATWSVATAVRLTLEMWRDGRGGE